MSCFISRFPQTEVISASSWKLLILPACKTATCPQPPPVRGYETFWQPVAGIDPGDGATPDGILIESNYTNKKTNNPDILLDSRNKYQIVYKTDTPASCVSGDHLYATSSSSLTGPYTPTIDSIYTNCSGSPPSVASQAFVKPSNKIEDPQFFQWKHKYFMLNYDLYSKYTSTQGTTYSGILWVSRTGDQPFDSSLAYIAEGALSDYVTVPAGATCGYAGDCQGGKGPGTQRMERPYMIFNSNGDPAYLSGTNAWNYYGNENGVAATNPVGGLANDYLLSINTLPMHNITVASETNGTVTVTQVEGNTVRGSQSQGQQYDDVSFTATPNTGHVVQSTSVTAKDPYGNAITVPVESLGGGQYRFMMPSGDATISVTFH
jgi:hypothetical protein